MIIYKDIVTDVHDELLSDSFAIKEVDGVIYEVDCSMITIGAVDVDSDEEIDDDIQNVNNIVHNFRLQPASFDKAAYGAYLKGYFKKVLASLKKRNTPEDEIITFKKGASAHSKRILSSFDDWEFYTGESMDVDGSVVLLSYREDGITPFLTYWKHGLEEMEV